MATIRQPNNGTTPPDPSLPPGHWYNNDPSSGTWEADRDNKERYHLFHGRWQQLDTGSLIADIAKATAGAAGGYFGGMALGSALGAGSAGSTLATGGSLASVPSLPINNNDLSHLPNQLSPAQALGANLPGGSNNSTVDLIKQILGGSRGMNPYLATLLQGGLGIAGGLLGGDDQQQRRSYADAGLDPAQILKSALGNINEVGRGLAERANQPVGSQSTAPALTNPLASGWAHDQPTPQLPGLGLDLSRFFLPPNEVGPAEPREPLPPNSGSRRRTP